MQKSHIVSFDVVYDLTQRWSLGAKYAYRLGQVSLDRVNPQFFDSRAQLTIVRADWQFIRRWDATLDVRRLDLGNHESGYNSSMPPGPVHFIMIRKRCA